MSSENSLQEKRRRRAERRQQATQAAPESEAVEIIESDDDFDDDEADARAITAPKGRPTRGRRQQVEIEAKEEGNFVTRRVRGIRDYWEGVRAEIQKVVWPTREETRRLTTIVIIVTVIASLVLGLVSWLFDRIIAAGLQTPALVFGGLFIGAVIVYAVYLRSSNRRTGSF